MHNLFDFVVVNLKLNVSWRLDGILTLTNSNLTLNL